MAEQGSTTDITKTDMFDEDTKKKLSEILIQAWQEDIAKINTGPSNQELGGWEKYKNAYTEEINKIKHTNEEMNRDEAGVWRAQNILIASLSQLEGEYKKGRDEYIEAQKEYKQKYGGVFNKIAKAAKNVSFALEISWAFTKAICFDGATKIFPSLDDANRTKYREMADKYGSLLLDFKKFNSGIKEKITDSTKQVILRSNQVFLQNKEEVRSGQSSPSVITPTTPITPFKRVNSNEHTLV